MAILGSAVAVLVVLSVVAFKKGYIAIEVVDEQEDNNSQGENQDYTI